MGVKDYRHEARSLFPHSFSTVPQLSGRAQRAKVLGSLGPSRYNGPVENPERAGKLFGELLAIMARLRAEGGCPWDREQTRQSLRPYLVEEAYEVLEALASGDLNSMREELGDLLFQVIFHVQISRERGEFTMVDLLETLTSKMIRRHPHVFGDRNVADAAQALAQWEAIKQAESEGKRPLMEGIPRSLPALLRAQRIQGRAARVGFDWERAEEAWQKVREELGEVEGAMEAGDPGRIQAELGDLLFAVVNVARLLSLDAETTLQDAIGRFVRRFDRMEAALAEAGKSLHGSSLAEMEAAWQAVKGAEPLSTPDGSTPPPPKG